MWFYPAFPYVYFQELLEIVAVKMSLIFHLCLFLSLCRKSLYKKIYIRQILLFFYVNAQDFSISCITTNSISFSYVLLEKVRGGGGALTRQFLYVCCVGYIRHTSVSCLYLQAGTALQGRRLRKTVFFAFPVLFVWTRCAVCCWGKQLLTFAWPLLAVVRK